MKKLLFVLLFTFFVNCNASELIVWKEDLDSITLDRFALQKIFTKKITKWPDGRGIMVFIKPFNSIEHRDFVLNVLGISVYTYQQMLETQVYSGYASTVIEVLNDKQMIMKVENTPGAIGYINYEIYVGNKKVIVLDSTTVQQ